MANSKRFAEKARTLTESQLFRIANYVPDNAEMYDDASIASIYGQIRAAQNELDRRSRQVRRNSSQGVPPGWKSDKVTPPSSLSASQRAAPQSGPGQHHYFDDRTPLRTVRLTPGAKERKERAETALGRVLLPVKDSTYERPVGVIGDLEDGFYAFQTSGVPGFAGDYIISQVADKKPQGFTTFYGTDETLYRKEDGTDETVQYHEDQMVPRWDTPTILFDAYVPTKRSDGSWKVMRASQGKSAMDAADRFVLVDKIVLKIMHLIKPHTVTWQEIMDLSKSTTEHGVQPLDAADVAQSVRRLKYRGHLYYTMRKLPFAPAELTRCSAKYCEPLFGLTVSGAAEAAKLVPSAPKKKNPKGDGLDEQRQEYVQLRKEAVALMRKGRKAQPKELARTFDKFVEGIRVANNYPKTAAGYVAAARMAHAYFFPG